MGRWKRKKEKMLLAKSATPGGSITTTTTKDDNRGFSTKDMKLLRKYLEEYRDGCMSMYYDNNGAGTTSSSFTLFFTKRKDDDDDNDDFLLPIDIGKCTFPVLNDQVFRQPYMKLPYELSKKQRRLVHEICTEVGLFHCGAGGRENNNLNRRYVAISAFSNGLSYLADLSNRSAFDATKYKPWACRRRTTSSHLLKTQQQQQQSSTSNGHSTNSSSTAENNILTSSSLSSSHVVERATKLAKDEIYELVDQPSQCLRDAIDTIDFRQIENDDLSQTEPPGFDEDEWMMVDSIEKMEQCIQEIKDAKPTEIAFDLESYNQSKYMQITCLIQIALANGKEYVIDPLAPGVWDAINGLGQFFSDPSIVKIGHSIGGLDIRCLHRDFGIFVVNAFDTYEAAQCLEMKGKGLAKVCAAYGLPDSNAYEALKSVYQTTDWTKRPLTKPMIEYGRYDVHYLCELRKLMMRDLTKKELWDAIYKANQYAEARAVATSLALMLRRFDEDEETTDEEGNADDITEDMPIEDDEEPTDENGEEERQSFFEAKELRMNLDLMQVISRSQDRCLDLWSNRPEPLNKNAQYQSIVVKCERDGIPFTSNQIMLYEKLADWREGVGQKEEISGGFVCPLDLIASISHKRPTSVSSLKKLSYFLPELLQNETTGYMEEIFQLVKESLEADGITPNKDDDEIPTYGSAPPSRRSYWSGYSKMVIGASICAAAAVGIALVVASSRKRGR